MVLLVEKRQLVVVVKQEVTPGSNTCDAQHGKILLNLLICFDVSETFDRFVVFFRVT